MSLLRLQVPLQTQDTTGMYWAGGGGRREGKSGHLTLISGTHVRKEGGHCVPAHAVTHEATHTR